MKTENLISWSSLIPNLISFHLVPDTNTAVVEIVLPLSVHKNLATISCQQKHIRALLLFVPLSFKNILNSEYNFCNTGVPNRFHRFLLKTVLEKKPKPKAIQFSFHLGTKIMF